MSIVGFANPLIIELSNVFMPKSVLTWKHGGGPELWHEAIRNTALIAALVVPLPLAALLAADTVMRFLYQNKEFESLGHTLTVLIGAMSAGLSARQRRLRWQPWSARARLSSSQRSKYAVKCIELRRNSSDLD